MSKVSLVFLMLLALLLLFLLLTVVRVQVSYSRRGRDDQFAVGVSAWRGLIHYTFELPEIKIEKKKRWPAIMTKTKVEQKDGDVLDKRENVISLPKFMRTASGIVNMMRLYGKYILGLLKKVRLCRLTWHTEIGASDSSQTGLLTGAVWGLKGIVLTAFCRILSPGGATPVVEVRPRFDEACFNTVLDCAFEVRLGHLFIIGIKYFIAKHKNKISENT